MALYNKKSTELKIEIMCFIKVLKKLKLEKKPLQEWEESLQWKYFDLLEKQAHLRLVESFYYELQRRSG